MKDGPLTCAYENHSEITDFNPKMDSHFVFDIKKKFFVITHMISIVGYDYDDKGLYWIVRNSMGREYGYAGFFLLRGGNELGINAQCVVPLNIEFKNWNE